MTVHVYVYENTETTLWFESLVVCEGGPWRLLREYDKEIPDPVGPGGTTDYNQLSNKPLINSVTLSGNKTSEQLNIQGGVSDAGAVTYDPEENYDEGTVGKALNQLGDTAAFKVAILQLAQKVAYIDEYGQNYYDDLYDALYPPVPLASISAVFNQGSAVVYDTNTLDDLKPMLTVTATYEDQTTGVVTNYTLSGTLTVGTSVITVSYRDKTTTFNVVVTEGNIFDPTTAGKNDLFVNTGTNKLAKSSSVQYKSAFIPISPNTTYKIDKDVCGQFRVATTIEEPALNVAITKTQANHSGSSITILSGDSDNWLFITYWADATSSSYDPDLILNSIKVYPS